MIAIVDYNIGNIGSLKNAFNFLGVPITLESDPLLFEQYKALILPGVGSFDTAMTSLTQKKFIEPIKSFVQSGRPILGICLGMQVLFRGSEEGKLPGLGILDGFIRSLKKLGCTGKVPHVGFNETNARFEKPGFLAKASGKDFYFVHSYALGTLDYLADEEMVVTEYSGATFVSGFRNKNVFATQFHPEKSGESGIQLLSEFVACLKSA